MAGGQGRWTDERGEEAGTRGGGLLGLTERPARKFGRPYIHIETILVLPLWAITKPTTLFLFAFAFGG